MEGTVGCRKSCSFFLFSFFSFFLLRSFPFVTFKLFQRLFKEKIGAVPDLSSKAEQSRGVCFTWSSLPCSGPQPQNLPHTRVSICVTNGAVSHYVTLLVWVKSKDCEYISVLVMPLSKEGEVSHLLCFES